MPSLDTLPGVPADTNEQQPVQQEVAYTEAPTIADVPQIPEIPSLDLGNFGSPGQPASTSES